MPNTTTAFEAPPPVDGLWRARELPGRRAAAVGICTGFPALDAALADRGWPPAGLAELLCGERGIGELSLLAPALATLSGAGGRCVAWIDPPFLPYAPALRSAGIDPAGALLVRPKDRGDALWAFEQACRSGACGAVLGWLAEPGPRFAEIRRLQLAARQGGAWAVLFRPAGAVRQASAAELRLRLRPLTVDRLGVDIVKRRGGWPLAGIELPLAAALAGRRLRLGEKIERWRRERFGAPAE